MLTLLWHEWLRGALPGWVAGKDVDGRAWEPAGSWGLYRSTIRDYMDRVILKTPRGTLRLHWILRADRGNDPHDHPFDFTSLILRGGYVEELVVDDVRVELQHLRGSVVRRTADQAHYITSVAPGTITLVVTGPKRKPWGFRTAAGWVHHREWRGVR